MALKLFLAAAFVALNLSTSYAAPNQELRPRQGGVCNSGIYAELAPILAGYSVAQSYCTAVFPVKCPSKVSKRALEIRATTTTATSTSSSPVSHSYSSYQRRLNKKQINLTLNPSITKTTSITKSSTTVNARSSALSKLLRQAANVISTMCSCVQTKVSHRTAAPR